MLPLQAINGDKLIREEICLEAEIPRVQDYLESTNFYVVERDLQVAERLEDLYKRNGEEFTAMVGGVFKWLNVATQSKGEGIIPGTESPEPFDINKKEDIERFFGEYLPETMGHYLAKFHKLGGIHKFPHSQNWSLVGSLYDLDSVERQNVNEPMTQALQQMDTRVALASFGEIMGHSAQNYLSSEFPETLLQKAQYSFMKTYIDTLFPDGLDDQYLEKIKEDYFSGLEPRRHGVSKEVDRLAWKRVVEEVHL